MRVNLAKLFMYSHNLLLLGAGVQHITIDSSFVQEHARIQAIRQTQEAARRAPDAQLHSKEEIEKKKRRPNQTVPGSKLDFPVVSVN